MLTIVFYGSDGAAAKARSKEIARNKPNTARVYDAFVWNGEREACDAVEILPCVPSWRREAIEEVFGGKVVRSEAPPSDGQELAACKMFNIATMTTSEAVRILAPRKGRGRSKRAS